MEFDLQTEYQCLLCGHDIVITDVNVATDLALCRACGKFSSFSAIYGAAEITRAALGNPPKHIKFAKDLYTGTTITYQKFSAILLFLIPFTAFWSGLSMWGIYGTQIRKGVFDIDKSLFGLPFLIGTIILLAVIATMILGKWKINLLKSKGTVFFGIGSLGWIRHFAYNMDTIVFLRNSPVSHNDVPQKCIVVQNGALELTFGTSLTNDAKLFIAAIIMKEAGATPAIRTTF